MFEYTLRNFNKIRDAVKEQPFNFKSISSQISVFKNISGLQLDQSDC